MNLAHGFFSLNDFEINMANLPEWYSSQGCSNHTEQMYPYLLCHGYLCPQYAHLLMLYPRGPLRKAFGLNSERRKESVFTSYMD